MRWCGKCQDWFPDEGFTDHIRADNIGLNSDATDRNNQHFSEKIKKDYAVCVLHQKKIPCPIHDCHLEPFGMIWKSRLMEFVNIGWYRWHDGYGNDKQVRIDPDTRIVVLFGVPIKIRI